ncbi:MAG TPA: DUF2336 domain-containing protein [Beijerinckiaceae bacterium]|nr:DUF2336 domain-containing protein [Beijerinckiaceae bacterium]
MRLASGLEPETRTELLHAVTDLYLGRDGRTEGAQDAYAGIAAACLTRMKADDRAAYAERVAPEAALPRVVARTLAQDAEAAVATPVLRRSPALKAEDLAAAALSGSQDRLRAIAGRERVPESVTEILVSRGGEPVLAAVAANAGAQLSEASLAVLAERTRLHLDVVRILARRFGTEWVARLARKRRIGLDSLMAEVRRDRAALGAAVEQLAVDGRALDVAEILAAVGGEGKAAVLQQLLADDGTAIAALCRRLGVRPAEFESLVRLRAARRGLAAAKVAQEIAAYEDAPPRPAAAAVVRGGVSGGRGGRPGAGGSGGATSPGAGPPPGP